MLAKFQIEPRRQLILLQISLLLLSLVVVLLLTVLALVLLSSVLVMVWLFLVASKNPPPQLLVFCYEWVTSATFHYMWTNYKTQTNQLSP